MPSFSESAFQRLTSLDPFPQPPVIQLRHPVVLLHGFGMMAGFRRNGHLHEEAMNLRGHGVLAYAPNVAPYNTVPVRAALWKERFERILNETGAEKLNLVAHSMGGLDARHLISRLGFHAPIASLTTVSTPHRGTYAASLLMQQPERLRSFIAGIADWMGALVLEDGTADFLQAVAELTPEHVTETFNPATPDHPSVRYWSYAGRAGKGTNVSISPFFRVMNHLLYEREGVNDGYVSVESARWDTFLGTVDADHARQVGLSPRLGDATQSNAFYRSVARMLADEGL